MEASANHMARTRIGLALGGGAARGWAHLGVIESLAEIGIKPDIVAGTSIGALVGGCYLSGHFKQLEKWACGLSRLKMIRYMDLKLRGRGLIGGDRLLAEMERHIAGVSIENLPGDLCQCLHGSVFRPRGLATERITGGRDSGFLRCSRVLRAGQRGRPLACRWGTSQSGARLGRAGRSARIW